MHSKGHEPQCSRRCSIDPHLLIVAGQSLLPARRGFADLRLIVAAGRRVTSARHPRHFCLIWIVIRRHDQLLRASSALPGTAVSILPCDNAVLCGVESRGLLGVQRRSSGGWGGVAKWIRNTKIAMYAFPARSSWPCGPPAPGAMPGHLACIP